MEPDESVELNNRPPRALSALFCLGVTCFWVWLRLVVFRESLLPLTYALPLLICVWSRDRLVLWAMAVVFTGAAAFKAFWLLPPDTYTLQLDLAVFGAKLINISVAAVVVHAIIRLREGLEHRNLELSRLNEALAESNEEISRQNEALERTNAELEAANEELVARDVEISRQNEELVAQSEELAQQNEELQAQGEELEQQNEEIASQAEELQAFNEELARREDMLKAMLASAKLFAQEENVLETVFLHGLRLLGEDVVAGAVVRPEGDRVHVDTYVTEGGKHTTRTSWPRERSLADIVVRENRTACLADVSLRPDLLFPDQREAAVGSILATPLRLGQSAAAAIEFYALQPRPWTQDQFRLAEWISAQCTPLLEMLELRNQLRNSEQRFRATFEHAAVGIGEVGLDGRFLQVNQKLCDVTGYSREELCARRFQEITHPDDLQADLDQAARLASGQIDLYTMEKRYLRGDGSIVWANLTRSVLRDAEGKPIHFIIAVEDITVRKHAEERLLRSERAYREQLAELQAVYDSVPIGLCVVDKDLRYLKVNRVLAGISGLAAEDHIGRSMLDVVPELAGQLQDVLRHTIATRTPMLDHEISGCTPDHPGLVRHWSGNYLPLLDEQLNLRGLNITLQETTERHLAERQRAELLEAERAARSAAEKHVRLKDEFLATVSHELRSPLNAIVGWTRLLAQAKVETAKAVDIIGRSASTLTQIVEDLLEMNRIMSGKIRLTRETVDLASLIHHTADGLRMAAEAKGIHLGISVDPELEPVDCDPNRIQQIVWNLLTNAIKFTDPGGQVFVAIAQSPGMVQMQVKDTGQGIAPEFLPHMFERFSQQDGSIARRHGGLGLGLAIVKSLVELHGGTVEVESAGVGKGATFTVTLPRACDPSGQGISWSAVTRPGMAEPVNLDECALVGYRVLCVDDDAYSRDLLERVLCDAGAVVRAAGSSEQAFEIADEFRPDLLISDIGMPGEDGYSFIARIRSMGDWRAELPCIAVTALSRPEDRRHALEAGYDDHVGKPFDPATLCLAAIHLLQARTKPAATLEPSAAVALVDAPHPLHVVRPHVLIAEDNESIGQLLKTCLEEEGYRVSLAASLADSVALAERDGIDLVLSDLQLKDGMGWDLLASMGRQVPGIVMSGHVDEEYMARSKAAGFREYLVKPVEPDRVVSLVRRLLKERGR